VTELVLSALVNRRAEIGGELEKAQARVQQLYADLASLDAVIRQFDPAHPVDAIQAKHRRAPTGEEFAALGRAALGMLRRAGGPVATTEIAERLIVERGLDVGNRAVRAGMLASVGSALRPQRGRGVVRTVRKVGKSVLWELAE
jgi:hypothetical protein